MRYALTEFSASILPALILGILLRDSLNLMSHKIVIHIHIKRDRNLLAHNIVLFKFWRIYRKLLNLNIRCLSLTAENFVLGVLAQPELVLIHVGSCRNRINLWVLKHFFVIFNVHLWVYNVLWDLLTNVHHLICFRKRPKGILEIVHASLRFYIWVLLLK